MQITCPNCRSSLNHRSRTKGIVETFLLPLIFMRPFRCEECDDRFFRCSVSEKPGPVRPVATS
jgi:hypothetical protein